jgi:hypothetical protein
MMRRAYELNNKSTSGVRLDFTVRTEVEAFHQITVRIAATFGSAPL